MFRCTGIVTAAAISATPIAAAVSIPTIAAAAGPVPTPSFPYSAPDPPAQSPANATGTSFASQPQSPLCAAASPKAPSTQPPSFAPAAAPASVPGYRPIS